MGACRRFLAGKTITKKKGRLRFGIVHRAVRELRPFVGGFRRFLSVGDVMMGGK